MNDRKINERGNTGAMKAHSRQNILQKMSQGPRGGGIFWPREFFTRKKAGSRKTHLLLHRFYSLP